MTQESNVQPNDRIAFDCEECGKNLQLTGSIYLEMYKDHTKCLSCRPAESSLPVEKLKLCEHGNYSCYTCEVKLLKAVIAGFESRAKHYEMALVAINEAYHTSEEEWQAARLMLKLANEAIEGADTQ